jgi:hypothetical protein
MNGRIVVKLEIPHIGQEIEWRIDDPGADFDKQIPRHVIDACGSAAVRLAEMADKIIAEARG